jgi:cation transport ATPase
MDSDYALIPQAKANMLVLSGLNDKLLTLNEQMNTTLTQINPQVEQQQKEKTQKQTELNDYYSKLLAEKIKMEQLLEEYNSISEDNEQQTLYANQQNATLRVWAIAACILLLIIVRMFITKSSTQISVAFWLILIILLIVLSYSLSKPSGFAIWGFLLIFIILMKLRVLPSP